MRIVYNQLLAQNMEISVMIIDINHSRGLSDKTAVGIIHDHTTFCQVYEL